MRVKNPIKSSGHTQSTICARYTNSRLRGSHKRLILSSDLRHVVHQAGVTRTRRSARHTRIIEFSHPSPPLWYPQLRFTHYPPSFGSSLSPTSSFPESPTPRFERSSRPSQRCMMTSCPVVTHRPIPGVLWSILMCTAEYPPLSPAHYTPLRCSLGNFEHTF